MYKTSNSYKLPRAESLLLLNMTLLMITIRSPELSLLDTARKQQLHI